MTNTEPAELRFCFWCGKYNDLDHCYNCGYEVGSLPPEVKRLIDKEVLKGQIEILKKHRRWFERMAEYADVKQDAMSEYDDEIATLEAQLNGEEE